MVALVDSGITNSFMNYELGLKDGYQLSYVQSRRVFVAEGGELKTDAVVENLKHHI